MPTTEELEIRVSDLQKELEEIKNSLSSAGHGTIENFGKILKVDKSMRLTDIDSRISENSSSIEDLQSLSLYGDFWKRNVDIGYLYPATTSDDIIIGAAGTVEPVSMLELFKDDSHPVLTITGAHDTDYNPQIQFRTGATPAVKFSIGVEGDKFKIFSGSGIDGTSEIVVDNKGYIGLGTDSPAINWHMKGVSVGGAGNEATGVLLQAIDEGANDTAPALLMVDKNWTAGNPYDAFIGFATTATNWSSQSVVGDVIIGGDVGIGFTTDLSVTNMKMYITNGGDIVIGNQQVTAASLLELWKNDGHPILSITAGHLTDYDPQIQFRNDVTDTVKFSVGVDSADDTFKIENGTGVGGASNFSIDVTTGAITFNDAYEFPVADGSATEILVTDGAGNLDFKSVTIAVCVPITMFDAVPSRGSESNWNGGLLSLATAQPLDSVPTDLVITKGIGKIIIVVNAGSDIDGEITVTGTSVDRSTGATTGADTDTITIDALTTDNSTTDSNGNTVHAFVGAYITSKWFTGSVTLSTANLTLTDVDVYHVSFEQLNDQPNMTLDTFDANIFTTNVNAEFDAYLYDLHKEGGDKCDIENHAAIHVGADGETAIANKYWRLRRGGINQDLDGTTDGFWVDVHYANSPVYVEDVTIKVWATKTQTLTLT